jgi:ribonuclease HI
MVYYAVANGRNIGIFTTWLECSNSVKGYNNAIFKKFNTKIDAQTFLDANTLENKADDFVPDYYVYTDGACSNNGKDNALAGIGIFFGIDDPRNVSKRCTGKQTNNIAELTAVIEVYNIIKDDIQNGKKIGIVTDSEYVIKCINSYGEKCEETLWIKNIPNKELVKQAYDIYKAKKQNIHFIHVKAHTNNNDVHSVGNNEADKLANYAIGLNECPYNQKMDSKR